MKTQQRKERLLPNGQPKYIRCYDNGGETFDRYTVCFVGKYRKRENGRLTNFLYLGMSNNPFHPQGFGQHGESEYPVMGSHLGKKIKFEQLPEDCKTLVLRDYKDIWDLN